jgi:hypothetical protein
MAWRCASAWSKSVTNLLVSWSSGTRAQVAAFFEGWDQVLAIERSRA